MRHSDLGRDLDHDTSMASPTSGPIRCGRTKMNPDMWCFVQDFRAESYLFSIFLNSSGPVVVDILPEETTLTATCYNIQSVHDQRPMVGTSKSLLLYDVRMLSINSMNFIRSYPYGIVYYHTLSRHEIDGAHCGFCPNVCMCARPDPSHT